MQVDEEPVKREEEESPAAQPEPDPEPEPEPEPKPELELELEPEKEQTAELEVQAQEDEDVPTPASPDTLPPSRSEGQYQPGTRSARELTTFTAKRKASDTDSSTLEGQRDKKRMREDSEPVDEEDGRPDLLTCALPPLTGSVGVPKTRRKERAGDKRFQNMIGMLHSQISQHRYGNIFHNPIKKSEAPDYHDIVKRPMDLKTIKARVKDGLISNSLEFQRDIFLMFANAMMYNRPGSEIYMMAEEMMTSSEREINAFRQTEGFHRM